MNRLLVALLLAVSALMPARAEEYAAGAIGKMDTVKGEVLTDARGMSLYIFDKDAAGLSNCYDDCATKWPPAIAAAGAMASGPFSLVSRKDGSRQWALAGKPLYLWQGDKKPGDVAGDGLGGVWHLARE